MNDQIFLCFQDTINKISYNQALKKLTAYTKERTKVYEEHCMCLSEHSFGTIKIATGFTYFLLRGLRKVTRSLHSCVWVII